MQPQPYPTYFNQPGPPAPLPPPQEPRGRGARPYTGAKRGRKPRGGAPGMAATPAAPTGESQSQSQSQPQPQAQTQSQTQAPAPAPSRPQSQPQAAQYKPQTPTTQATPSYSVFPAPQSSSAPPLPQIQAYYTQQYSRTMPPPQYAPLSLSTAAGKGKGKEDGTTTTTTSTAATRPPIAAPPPTFLMRYPSQGHPVVALSPAALQASAQMRPHPISASVSVSAASAAAAAAAAAGEDEDDADELPMMSDDVYGQGLAWQSQSKDNLKILMDNFTPEQFERYEAYRRSALPKQSVRKVVHQSTNYTISQPVAQVMAGFAKVFVGEIVEKARAVQARYGESPDTPLSPEHLREAYRIYQQDTGRVGAARVHKGKRLFIR